VATVDRKRDGRFVRRACGRSRAPRRGDPARCRL